MAASSKAPSYNEDKDAIRKFLQEFVAPELIEETGSRFKYLAQMQAISNRQLTQLAVDVEDISSYGDERLAEAVRTNTRRYLLLFAEVVDEIKPAPTVELSDTTVLDVFIHHRTMLAQNAADAAPAGAAPQAPRYPPELLRRFEVVFRLPPEEKPLSIRQIEASHVGRLVKFEGIVIRATAVKPSVTVAAYACDQCQSEIYQQITGPTFMPMQQCSSTECVTNRRNGRLHLLTRGSRFERFQELRVQEMASHVPPGGIPRTIGVHLRGEVTRSASPGDVLTVTGIFLPVPHQGYRAIRAGLLSDTFVDAQIVEKEKRTHNEQVITDTVREEIESRARDADIYDQLAGSLCPHIYGHDDVKKALLLLLVGGADRKMKDGMRIRGDMHICLMGDPGVAKSQMLKAISDLAPRGVYTTGRGSSGVGLTAAVTKDPLTNELVLEGGALVLADMGVCCIDEFDKMDEGDRTSIHEVMEQQTVSIAKAGITTTLNARSSILAAANPLYGRYNPKKSATHNINLPAALLSRFDLLFLLLDRPDMEADLRLAQHITYVHTHNDFPPLEHVPLDKDFVRNYVSLAKGYSPVVPAELTDYIVGVYVALREEEKSGDESATFTSARSLLSILRLATALARLRFSERVEQDDVEEALRLVHMSKASVNEQGRKRGGRNPINEIYEIIRTMANDADRSFVSMDEARLRALRAGFRAEQFQECLTEYERLDVWHVNHAGTKIEFVM